LQIKAIACRCYIDSNWFWCSGSTIVGVGDPEPPKFIYDDDEYSGIFISGEFII
jgi:hypothetical protein